MTLPSKFGAFSNGHREYYGLQHDKGEGPSNLLGKMSSTTATGALTPTLSIKSAADRDAGTVASGAAGVPFENLFTLPWALHLQPLPHTSFLIRPDDSGGSSEASSLAGERADGDGDDGGSDAESDASNYRAGLYRLERVDSSLPPHSLRTISMLLERTRCLETVPIWARLFELLNTADDDPHFANLRAFFDARFDRSGKLVQAGHTSPSSPLASSSAMQRLQSGSDADFGAIGRSPSVRSHSQPRPRQVSQPWARRNSNQQQAFGSPPKNNDENRSPLSSNPASRFLRNRTTSQSYRHDDGNEADDSSAGRGPGGAQRSTPLRAPEITLVTRATGEARTTRFKVRLDLHAVGLAPSPPKPPSADTSSRPGMHQQPSSISARLDKSPSGKGFPGPDANRLQQVRSNGSSSERSYADGISLHAVKSPDSFRSRVLSDSGDGEGELWTTSHSQGPESGYQSFAPSRRLSDMEKGTAAVETHSRRERAATQATTGPRRTFSKLGSFSKADRNRRPSMLQRIIDFGSFRNKSAISNESGQAYTDDDRFSNGSSREPSRYTPASSQVDPWDAQSAEGSMPLATASMPSSALAQRRFSRTEASENSNDEALDTGEDDGSVSSSRAHFSQRRPSSAAALQAYRTAPELDPVQEGAVLTVGSSDEGHGMQRSTSKEAAFAATSERFKDGGDFLSLLRAAANTSLTLQHGDAVPDSMSKAASQFGDTETMTQSPVQEMAPDSLDQLLASQSETLLAPFKAGGSAAWWLSGSADPLPVSIACALSQALGWDGIMDLCYGPDSSSAASGMFQPLGKAAQLDSLQQQEKQRVEDWAQSIAEGDSTLVAEGVSFATTDAFAASTASDANVGATHDAAVSSDIVAPSESASMQGLGLKDESKADKPIAALSKLITSKLRTKSVATAPGLDDGQGGRRPSLFDLPVDTGDQGNKRTWKDWAELMKSISRWMQTYELCRVRNGLAGEIGTDAVAPHADDSTSLAYHPESGFLDASMDVSKARYSSRMSYKVPVCVVKDATNRQHGFRRRDGVPEGLPLGPNGEEMGDYRWSNKRLSRNHVATSATLAASSMSHILGQLAYADWPHASAWELDYLEMCVFRSPVVARRFPPPGDSIVASSQHFVVPPGDEVAAQRAMPCPYPSASGEWDAEAWMRWLGRIRGGKVIVPAVSWQAWWTLIAVLNGADGSGRPLDVQLKAEEEPFDTLTDPDAVYL